MFNQPPETPETQQAQGTSTVPPAEDYKARYSGATRKIEELVLANRKLEADLAAKVSEAEQLRAQLALKDTEKSVAVSERDKQLQEMLSKSQEAETELKTLRALQLKVKVAKDIGRPELMKILDSIPALETEEALRIVMNDFAKFADDAVIAREKQLLAGVTPGAGFGSQAAGQPASDKAWEDLINSLPLGSTARQKALYDYGAWLEKTNK